MTQKRRSIPTLSIPVAIAFFLLTNAVFLNMASEWYLASRLQEYGEPVEAVITHNWQASGSGFYIGYAYVDQEGMEHKGSARITGDGEGLFEIGTGLEILVDRDTPRRSGLADRSHVSMVQKASSSIAMVALTGMFAIFGWWLLVSRLKRSWTVLRARRL